MLRTAASFSGRPEKTGGDSHPWTRDFHKGQLRCLGRFECFVRISSAASFLQCGNFFREQRCMSWTAACRCHGRVRYWSRSSRPHEFRQLVDVLISPRVAAEEERTCPHTAFEQNWPERRVVNIMSFERLHNPSYRRKLNHDCFQGHILKDALGMSASLITRTFRVSSLHTRDDHR